MRIQRSKRTSNFTILANSSIRDPHLSLRARGLLATLLSMPDDWKTSTDAISKTVKEGRDAVRVAARELEAAGYLVRSKQADAQGRWSTTWVLHDEPVAADSSDESSTPSDVVGPAHPTNSLHTSLSPAGEHSRSVNSNDHETS